MMKKENYLKWLLSIIKYLSNQRNNADSENFNDFIRNILANMISTNMEQHMFSRSNLNNKT